jgi:putative ABC transport system permease protein
MIKLAFRNARRNWRHSLSTVLSVASGFAAVALFDGFLRRVDEESSDGYTRRAMLGHVVVEKPGAATGFATDPWRFSLDAADQKFLEDFFAHDPAVRHSVRILNLGGMASMGRADSVFISYAYEVQSGVAVRGKRWAWNAVAGKPLHLVSGDAALLGRGLAHVFGCKELAPDAPLRKPEGGLVAAVRPFSCPSPDVTLTVTTEAAQVNVLRVPVAGFFDAGFRETDKRAVVLPLDTAQKLLDTDKVTFIGVQLGGEGDVPAFSARLRAAAASRGLAFDAVPWADHRRASFVKSSRKFLRVFRNVFLAIVAGLSMLSVANTMMRSIDERTREIGTLRSLGWRRPALRRLFAWEGFFLSVLACALGLAATLVIAAVLAAINIQFRAGALSEPMRLEVAVAPLAWAASAAVLTVLAGLTAWLCARRAARMEIAAALRHV